MNNTNRIVSKLISSSENTWIEIPFKEIKNADVFRLFEPDGQAVKVDGMQIAYFIAKGDSYLNDDGIWTVEIY